MSIYKVVTLFFNYPSIIYINYSGISLLVMANKCDLDGALDKEHVSQVCQIFLTPMANKLNTQLLRLHEIKKHHWKIFETSAYTGHNLIEALEWLCRDVASRVLVPV